MRISGEKTILEQLHKNVNKTRNMKMLFIALLMGSLASHAQYDIGLEPKKISHWKMDRNKVITGSLVFIAGASKGFNETLMFHWDAFHQKFPHANPNWYNPESSWKNKYKDGDPDKGAKFPLSTTMLVATTDQYHFNNFINKTAWVSTIMIKMSEPRKSFKHYFLDMLYYTACHQMGFALTYYSFTKIPRPH
jgi:hypothetical protein